MRIEKFDQHMRTLATLEPNQAPVISCYLNVSNPALSYLKLVSERADWLRTLLPAGGRALFDEAFIKIEAFLREGIEIPTRGLALFARGGQHPFFLPLQFEVPLADWIAADSAPNLYPLLELRDNYDRYVILLVTGSSARIMEVSLGSITGEIWHASAEHRHPSGTEWTREHFQAHWREETDHFIHDQIRTLTRVMAAGRYTHLLLAGDERAMAAVRKALPKSLEAKLVDAVPTSSVQPIAEVVSTTLRRFLEYEELGSRAVAERLVNQVYARGLAVAGTHASMQALKDGQADVLVIAKDYDPGRGWECRRCGKIGTQSGLPELCSQCRSRALREFEIRGELVRLAVQLGCGVEVVERSKTLTSLGGVGCLLRYLAPEKYAAQGA